MKKFFLLLLSLAYFNIVTYAADFKNLVIYTEDDPPYVTVDAKGKVGGLTLPTLEKLLKEMNFPKEKIKVEPWARSYIEATSNPNVMIYAIVKTPERLEKLEYIQKLYDVSVYFYQLASRKDIKIKKIEDAKKYSICVVRSDYRQQHLKKLAFPKLEESTDSTKNVQKFMDGACDLAILSETGLYKKLDQLKNDKKLNPKKFERSLVKQAYKINEFDNDLYIAINKGTDPKTISALKEAAKAAFK